MILINSNLSSKLQNSTLKKSRNRNKQQQQKKQKQTLILGGGGITCKTS